MRRTIALTVLLVLAFPTAAAASWGADRPQTRSGSVQDVRAAGGNGDRIAVTWARRLGREQRAELRLGRARDGLTAAPQVLDRSPNSVEAPVTTYVRDGAFATAWRRFQSGEHRIQYRTVSREGRLSGKFNATTTGESAFLPEWVGGPTPALTWSRRTRADAVELSATAGQRGVRLPAAPLSEPGLAADADGLATVAWVNEGRVLVSDRGASGFDAPFVLATGAEVNRPEVVRVAGATLVFWRDGQELVVAVRPADGGAFEAPRPVLPGTTDGAQLAVTATNEVLVVAPTGDQSDVGELRLVRLGADGAPLGPTRSLGRGRRAQLAADGTGSAFVAWLSEGAERRVTARRIAAGGILGAPRVLAARSDSNSRPALAATREGGAVAAWIAGGTVRARVYRR